jgi:hypothetical protein
MFGAGDDAVAVGEAVLDPFLVKLRLVDPDAGVDRSLHIEVRYDGEQTFLCRREADTGVDSPWTFRELPKEQAIAQFIAEYQYRTDVRFGDVPARSPSPWYPVKTSVIDAARWEYFLVSPMDGMAAGWHRYAVSADETLERVFSEWKATGAGLHVRCVKSGHCGV